MTWREYRHDDDVLLLRGMVVRLQEIVVGLEAQLAAQ
jgi:hypothetical protein